ncbi:MAG: NnrS family protein [Gammaproteobacteria bacterium]|nr:NnrS family protein [Gammaproteobacteria bacterium]
MTLLSPDLLRSTPPPRFALWQLGFRPFFLAGSLYALVAMTLWLLQNSGFNLIPSHSLPAYLWHAHEMIFGFTLAIVVGFLLTAAKNWTGIQTLRNLPLAALLLLWLLARLAMWWHELLPWAVVLLSQVTFIIAATLAIASPLLRARQWHQMSIVGKLGFLAVAELLFFLGLNGTLPHGLQWGLYSGFYTLLALVLLMIRRVVPFFIERGLQGRFQPQNHRWVDLAGLWLFTAFAIVDAFALQPILAATLALLLALLHAYRFVGWHHREIWGLPLVWSLMAAYLTMIGGFLLHFLTLFGYPHSWAMHAFAIGTFGLITTGMMARVTLGHTGRDINRPPSGLSAIFILLLLALLLRLLLPQLSEGFYPLSVQLAQGCWIGAYAIFSWHYLPLLWQPRIDGQPG